MFEASDKKHNFYEYTVSPELPKSKELLGETTSFTKVLTLLLSSCIASRWFIQNNCWTGLTRSHIHYTGTTLPMVLFGCHLMSIRNKVIIMKVPTCPYPNTVVLSKSIFIFPTELCNDLTHQPILHLLQK